MGKELFLGLMKSLRPLWKSYEKDFIVTAVFVTHFYNFSINFFILNIVTLNTFTKTS